VSLQAECLADVLLDHKNSEEHGFVFVERPNDYALADDAPDYRIENDRICAMFDGNPSIEQLSKDDQTKLQILCKPRFPATFLPPNLVGYPLAIAEGEAVRKLECRD
jgi:hypothetical protein